MKTKSIVALILAVFMVITFFFSFKIIPTGYTGVRITVGEVSQTVVQKHWNWKIPYFQSIKKVNNKQQDKTFADDGEKSRIWAESSERTPLYLEKVIITYTINPQFSAWIFSNVTGGVDELVSDALVSSSLKASTKQLTAGDATNRAKIQPLAKEILQADLDEKYGPDVVTIEKIVINQMDFEEAYLQSIAAKSEAQLAYEQAQIDNKKKVEAEQAAADQKLIQSNNNAAVKKIDTDAEVYAITEKAKAQAEANRLLTNSLTGQVLYQQWISRWDGKLPIYAGQDSALILQGLTGQGTPAQ